MRELRSCSRFFYRNLCKTISNKVKEKISFRGRAALGAYNSLSLSSGEPALILYCQSSFGSNIFFSALCTDSAFLLLDLFRLDRTC